jgi:hypothetical protein
MAVGVDGRGRLLVVADVAGAGTPAVQLPAAPWPIADHGWAGVDVAVDSSAAVVVRTLPRMVAVHALATGQTVRAAALPGQPAGVKCLADAAAPALAVIVAGAQALVWDARVAEGGGVVARAKARRIAHTSAACVRHTHAHPHAQTTSAGALYAVATAADGRVAVAGEDRAVAVYDPRRWNAPAGVWANALKQTVRAREQHMWACAQDLSGGWFGGR